MRYTKRKIQHWVPWSNYENNLLLCCRFLNSIQNARICCSHDLYNFVLYSHNIRMSNNEMSISSLYAPNGWFSTINVPTNWCDNFPINLNDQVVVLFSFFPFFFCLCHRTITIKLHLMVRWSGKFYSQFCCTVLNCKQLLMLLNSTVHV